MTSSSRTGRAALIAMSIVIVAAAALWVYAVNSQIGDIGPSCAAMASC